MARVGISITKSTPFRNSIQEFSNVYYYENALGGVPSVAEANSLMSELVAFERTVHGGSVTFKNSRCWSQTGSQATNEMISQQTLSGTGSATSDATVDRERAYLFKIRAGVDVRGNPVFLRKWYHTCGTFPGATSISASITANLTGFSQAQRDAMVGNMQTIGAIGGGTEPWKLCSKSGRSPTAGASFQAHPFYEHHQLGDQWRNV